MSKNNFPLAIAGVYSDAFAVTPDDDNDLAQVPQALWIGATGNLVVTMPSGVVTIEAVPAGTEIKLRALRVMETSTASSIIALV